MSRRTTELLIIGAGPFGLAMAAHARHLGIEHVVVGEPMSFWRNHMPQGMYLRSACDWHLDPQDVHTIEAYLRELGLTAGEVEPLARDRYLEYARWFQERKGIEPVPLLVERLDAVAGQSGMFEAALADGSTIVARHVVLALGFRNFKNLPDDLMQLLPPARVQHTCDFVDFSGIGGERVLIVGGRQSAYESAALMCEAGAAEVHVCHRHDVPAFAVSDWSWVNPLVDGMVKDPRWYRDLTQEQRDEVGRRMFAEGRLKLEPWLASRVRRKEVRLWPNSRVAACRERHDGALEATLDAGGSSHVVHVDRVVLATGYKVDISRVPFLARGNMLAQVRTENDFPLLDEHMQSSVPGLFMTSMPAVGSFGPFFAFTVAARASARLIGQALRAS